MLITPEYRDLNRQLHETRPDYGTTAPKYVDHVAQIATMMGAVSILDYGCGKGLLAESMRNQYPVLEFDPCIDGKDAPPAPADLVVSVDVMEHIEPDCLDAVLDDIARLAKRAVYLTVATRPAVKTLADGRNAHLIVEPIDWWLPKLLARWSPRLITASEGEFVFFAVAKEQAVAEAA